MAGNETNWDTHNNRSNDNVGGGGAPTLTHHGLNDLPDNPKSWGDGDWRSLAERCFATSTAYFEASIAPQIVRNLRIWQGRHPQGSKYYSDDYRGRSKLFRPKTRATIRKNEAQAAAAFFSSLDVASIEPADDSNEMQADVAGVIKQLVQHRLTKTVPWFLTCIGAYQDAQVVGECWSRQTWVYEEVKERKYEPMLDAAGEPIVDSDGEPVFDQVAVSTILVDEPQIDLIPRENVRYDPGCDWRDPVKTSPYLIVRWPMYVCDVRRRARTADPKTGQPQWKMPTAGELAAAKAMESDNVRLVRERGQQDSKAQAGSVWDYTIVWVHENIMRVGHQDWHYYTLGPAGPALTQSRPLKEVYLQGERPFARGVAVIETHKTSPASKVELGQDMQTEVNELTNQRMDNIKLALNGRVIVRKGGAVDTEALKRSTPGGLVRANNPETDIKFDRPQDVTSSSFEEHDRLAVDFDEIMGSFSPGSVSSNRKLNETVGGLQLLSGSANAIGEYDVRVFVETWMEPVLRQLVRLEQVYETDEVLISIAASKAGAFRQGLSQLTEDAFMGDMTTTVNVGMGATDPMQRLQKLAFAAKTVGELLGPTAQQRANHEEVINEVFGAAGWRDGKRFFNFEEQPLPPEVQQQMQQMQQALAEAQQMAQSKQAEQQAKVAAMQQESAQRLAQMDVEHKQKMRMQWMDFMAKMEQQSQKLGLQMNLDEMEADTDRQIALMTAGVDARQSEGQARFNQEVKARKADTDLDLSRRAGDAKIEGIKKTTEEKARQMRAQARARKPGSGKPKAR